MPYQFEGIDRGKPRFNLSEQSTTEVYVPKATALRVNSPKVEPKPSSQRREKKSPNYLWDSADGPTREYIIPRSGATASQWRGSPKSWRVGRTAIKLRIGPWAEVAVPQLLRAEAAHSGTPMAAPVAIGEPFFAVGREAVRVGAAAWASGG